MTERQPSSRTCFVCGRENPIGLKVRWEQDRERGEIRGTLTLRAHDPRIPPRIRFNYMSQDEDWADFRTAVRMAREAGHTRVYGIGGSSVYAALLPLADRLVVTEVDLTVEKADAFFPDFDVRDWRLIGRHGLTGTGPECVLTEWLRRS